MMKNMKTCALCKTTKELRKSHVLPKFVINFLKKDSFTNKFRNLENSNISRQDGEKEYLLCNDCEQLFSVSENLFAKNVFYPFKKQTLVSKLKYQEWLTKFIVSVNWRCLYLDILRIEQDREERGKISTSQLDILKDSEMVMSEFLLGNRVDLGSIENHIFFFDEVKSMNENLTLHRPHSSVHGSIGGYTVWNEDSICVFTNLAGVFIITIFKKGKSEKWKNTYVKKSSGVIRIPQFIKGTLIANELTFLNNSLKYNNLSDKQRNKIVEHISSNIDKFKASGSYKRYVKDKNLNTTNEI
ncbi:hypothetical protein HFE03_07400 [Paenibacillus sp. EKM102P]|uniref:hypothetical protein n=1 Tax=unclassified Paenibacillus TaxID=185978 RepID=UPI00142DFC64|nr:MULTISPECIES: hypothetical protein [unclassified Paenibacillus]KAF6620472.1 hypothetical protein HFE00_05305 [Paenibacillus sp. EKM101P]KAF6623464.1 hypothetical protein HFE03_07400 [Paenibacillus sp. EKM102P]KAF6633973.1 hypothetical protein HFE01_07105 [Paenibacillus sp. EKM10P]KAF6649500.1 hypothetical protein HFE02_02070 [Paenibacillus sp. EKM11P]